MSFVSPSIRFSPPRRGRVREGVKCRSHSRHFVTPILTFPHQEVLQSAYDAYAKALVNRRLEVPLTAVTQAVENAREEGSQIRRKPAEIVDNSFAEQLNKSGFLKELWGRQL